MRWLVASVLFALPAAAQTCPPVPDQSGEEAELRERLRTAERAAAARVHTAALWEIWKTAPDRRAQKLLATGEARLRRRELDGAEEAFDKLADYCPHYAEGHNQLAIVAFMRRDFEAALVHVNRALERDPDHIGALSGKALSLLGLGRTEAGYEVLRRAVQMNPWLPERRLLPENRGEPL